MLNRRRLLQLAGSGFGQLALLDLLAKDNLLAAPKADTVAGPMAPKAPHFAPKAKSVIWLYMEGGPSACDTFDPKPKLTQLDGKQPPNSIDVYFGKPGPLMRSPYTFRQHGECGAWVSDWLMTPSVTQPASTQLSKVAMTPSASASEVCSYSSRQ